MATTKAINDFLAHFERTSDQFFSKDELRQKLREDKKLRVKYGVDVTAPLLHTGHAVNLWLMRYMQDLGHKIVFLIGDFTTRIGDPTGRSDSRPVIPREEIDRNAELFIAQAKMVLRFDDPALIEVRRNSEWYDKMQLQDFMNLLAMVTHAKLISRDMFQQRIEGGADIHMHEMLYPVLQGYDSVMVNADMTIIGSDQLFNEMMGRFFQERNGQSPQTIVTTKITPGIDGKAKQSKSLGNYIGLGHSARDKFGRAMSIPDTLIADYLTVYTDVPPLELARLKSLAQSKPREAKVALAYHIVERYHGPKVADWEREWFDHTISKGLMPDDIPTLTVLKPDIELLELVQLVRVGKSRSDTRRLIQQGAVELNGDKLDNPAEMLMVKNNDILKVGKRNWYRIEIAGNNQLITEHLRMDPMELKDLALLTDYLPAWEIVKYLTKPLSAWVAGGAGRTLQLKNIAPPGQSSTVTASVAREVFRKIISKPEPKDEWLWTIKRNDAPEEAIGVAHLRRDFEHGNQNVWLVPEHQNPALAQEAMQALNAHAFNNLGFNTMIFKEAFSHVARDTPAQVMQAEPALTPIDPATWGMTKDAWQQTQPLAPAQTPAPVQPVQPATALPPQSPLAVLPFPQMGQGGMQPAGQTTGQTPGQTPVDAAPPQLAGPVTPPQLPPPASPFGPKKPPGKT